MDHAVTMAITEYNSYGLALRSPQLRIPERETFGMKVAGLHSGNCRFTFGSLRNALCSGDYLWSMQRGPGNHGPPLALHHVVEFRHITCLLSNQASTLLPHACPTKPLTPAFTVECIRSSRWLLGQSGRMSTAFWKQVELVDRQKQLLFLDRVLFHFRVRRKQVRHISSARMNPEQWDQCLEVCCLLGHALQQMTVATGRAHPCFAANPIKCKLQRKQMELAGDDGKGLLFEPLEKARRRVVEGLPGRIEFKLLVCVCCRTCV